MGLQEVAGSSNVQIGKADFSGQSGKQTEMLLARAKENASDTAMLFNEFKREQGIYYVFCLPSSIMITRHFHCRTRILKR